MKKFSLIFMTLFVIMAVPVFSQVSVDFGVAAFGTASVPASRPLGGAVGLGFYTYGGKVLILSEGTFFSPALGDSYTDPAGAFSAGVLFSPISYVYLGLCSGMISPPDDGNDWTGYGAAIIRVQNYGKGMHFYAESEISFNAIFSKFSVGINFTL